MPRKSKRKFRTDKEKSTLLRRYRGCGLTVRDFCDKEGIHQNQFYLWRRKLKNGPALSLEENFVRINPPAVTHGLEIALPNGIGIKTSDGMVPVSLIKSLMEF